MVDDEKASGGVETCALPSLPSGAVPGSTNPATSPLRTKLGFWTSLALGFVCVSSWINYSTTMSAALLSGGPSSLLYGFLTVLLGSLSSVAECCSLWPSAGAQVVWAHALSPAPYTRKISYAVGWCSTVGMILLRLSGEVIIAEILLAMAQIALPGYEIRRWHTTLLLEGVAVLSAVYAIFASRILAKTNLVALVWSLAGALVIMIVLLAKTEKFNDARWTLATFINETGWPNDFLPFVVGLTQSGFAIVAYDVISHLCEEMADPARVAPKAMIGSVATNGVLGLVFILVFLFTIPHDVAGLADTPTGFPFLQLKADKTGSVAGGILLTLILVIPMVTATCDVNVSAARSVYAFSRDGGLPYSSLLGRVHKGLDVPLHATAVVFAVQMPLAFIYIGNTAAFNAFISMPVIALNIGYGIPSLLMLFWRRRQQGEERDGTAKEKDAPFSLGGLWGPLCNVTSVIFTIAISVFLTLPPEYPVTA